MKRFADLSGPDFFSTPRWATCVKPGNTVGRKPGVPNKITAECREAIQLAFEGIGGVEALTVWAKENRTNFYTKVWVRLLPLAVKPDQETPVTYETMEEVEAAIAERALPLKRLTPLLLELEAERKKANGGGDPQR